MTSRREKDRTIAEGLRRLKAKPGWDPSVRNREQPLRDLLQTERTGDTYVAAEACADCQKARATGDATALCPIHLAAAMGL